MTAVLAGVLVFAGAVWTGGLVAIFVVARVARRTLGAAERVAFFRALRAAIAAFSLALLALGVVIAT